MCSRRQTELVSLDDLWAPVAGRFVDGHYGTLRGRVRTYVIAAHLRDHLPGAPAALIDIGGGAGHQSIPLARAGYQVTIVDPCEAMLARARVRLADEPGEVSARVRLVQASRRDPYRLMSRLFHLVGRRTATRSGTTSQNCR